jgi:hypothetical protein
MTSSATLLRHTMYLSTCGNPYKTAGKITAFYVFVVGFSDRKRKDKGSVVNGNEDLPI